MNLKSIFASKTFYVAVAQAAAGGFAQILSTDPTVHTAGWLAIAKSFIDVLVRFNTNQGVTLTGGAK